jgi:hypothetical protein
MRKDSFVELTTEGRVAVHVTADGAILHYTYPDQNNNIPEGFRRVSYLEPMEGYDENGRFTEVYACSGQTEDNSTMTNSIDLTENKIPFGLLSEEEQEHLNSWPHGLLILGSSIVGRPIWHRANPTSKLSTTDVYRTIPAPKRETVWLAPTEFNDMSAEVNQSDAHDALNEHGGFALRIEFDATTGDNPTIVKENFDE